MSATTLRSAEALAGAGLIASDSLPALERVAAQYAVAITPAMADLIDAADCRRSPPIRSATSSTRRWKASSTAIRTAAC